jgi:peroxiredoxin
LQTDRALVSDPSFCQWVDKYADDRDLFFSDFAAAFAKLLELGVKRDQHSYKPAEKKSDAPGAPNSSGQDAEAEPVRRGNIATGKARL